MRKINISTRQVFGESMNQEKNSRRKWELSSGMVKGMPSFSDDICKIWRKRRNPYLSIMIWIGSGA